MKKVFGLCSSFAMANRSDVFYLSGHNYDREKVVAGGYNLREKKAPDPFSPPDPFPPLFPFCGRS